MALTMQYTCTLVQHTCWVCGVKFGLDERHEANLRQRGENFYCPKGCCLRFGKSEAQKLRDELEQEKRVTQWEREAKERANRRAVAAEHSWRVTKGHLTRIKKRVGAGVCPCCNRTFAQLAAHMASKHPGWAGDRP